MRSSWLRWRGAGVAGSTVPVLALFGVLLGYGAGCFGVVSGAVMNVRMSCL